MPALSVLVKPASGACNMHCDYCFYCDEISKRQTEQYGMMSDATLRNVIKRTLMRSEGMYTIVFQGGEPTLCGIGFFRRALQYLNKYNRNHCQIQVALQTNGYGMNEAWAVFLAENHILTGLSVDGLQTIHTKYRHGNDGGDSWEHVQRAAALLDANGVEYNILTVVHRMTAENIRQIYSYYKARGWRYQQYIACLDPIGETYGQAEYSLLPETYGRFLCDLFDLWYEDFQKGEQPYIRQFENYVGILLGYPPESCDMRGHCSIQYVVEADGSVFPCDFYVMDGYRLGNFNQDLLPAIDEKRRQMGFLERSHKIDKKCLSCRWYPLCRCGCYRTRVGIDPAVLPSQSTNTDQDSWISYFCPAYQQFFSYAYERLCRCAKS